MASLEIEDKVIFAYAIIQVSIWHKGCTIALSMQKAKC